MAIIKSCQAKKKKTTNLQLYEHLLFFEEGLRTCLQIAFVGKKSLKNFLSVSSQSKPQKKKW